LKLKLPGRTGFMNNNMKNLDELNKLSAENIQNLSEEEILFLAMERPGHPGQYGFLLQISYFKSKEHLSQTMFTLMQRLQKVKNLHEKMSDKAEK